MMIEASEAGRPVAAAAAAAVDLTLPSLLRLTGAANAAGSACGRSSCALLAPPRSRFDRPSEKVGEGRRATRTPPHV